MPGNTTTPRTARTWLPYVWSRRMSGNQARPMEILGSKSTSDVPMIRRTVVLAAAVILSDAITNSKTIDFELAIDGVGISAHFSMAAADGKSKLVEFGPGLIVIPPGQTIGVIAQPQPGLQPAQIEALIAFEVRS